MGVMDEQVPGQTAGTTSTGMGQDPSGMSYLRELMQRQGDTTGLTRMGPQVPQQQQQPQQREQRQGQQPAQDFASAGAAKKQSMQNLTATIHNTVQGITQKIEQRKQRETVAVTDKFAQSVQGLQQAQGMKQQAQQVLKQAVEQFRQAQQTGDQAGMQKAQQVNLQAKQQMDQASQAEQQNRTNLDDMFNGPKGEKHAKLLQKAFGIDDKNAGTPERQAAIASLKKTMGVGDKAAGILSRLPQGMQLSAQGQQQQMTRQAGVTGQPATGGQQLNAATRTVQVENQKAIATQKALLAEEKLQSQAGQKTDELVAKLPALGLMVDKNADGSYKRNPDGTLATRNMTLSELQQNPQLQEKYVMEQAKTNLMVAQAKATTIKASVAQQREARLKQQAQTFGSPQVLGAWLKFISNPGSGITLANAPKDLKSALVLKAAEDGLDISKPLTGDEIKRADLAHNAQTNLAKAQDVLARRPDLFGPAGWGKSNMEKALAGGDPDAIKFQTAIELANLPAVGIHGVRGKWALEDLKKLDGNLYLNPESMHEVLTTIDASAGEFAQQGGRRGLSNTTGSGSDLIYAMDPQGKLHKAKKGTALPSDWKPSQGPQ